MLCNKHHYSPMEFGTVYLTIPMLDDLSGNRLYQFYIDNPYSVVKYKALDSNNAYVTTNMRVILENNRFDDLKYLDVLSIHERRIMLNIVTSRAIVDELVRHRCGSFCVESTRYCSYAKNKFNGELTFIEPVWFSQDKDGVNKAIYLGALSNTEDAYLDLIKHGLAPQHARGILDLDLKSEMMFGIYEKDLPHLFELRCSSAAHPQIQELMQLIKQQINEKHYNTKTS